MVQKKVSTKEYGIGERESMQKLIKSAEELETNP
jgi:hypothetical protein